MTQSPDTVSVNLYPSAEITIPERGVRLQITSDFPRMTKARIRVECEKPQTFTLALRVPPWAQSMVMRSAGGGTNMSDTNRRALLLRSWKGVSTVDVEFVTKVRTVPWPLKNPKGVAVFDGPLCLGLSSSDAKIDLPWAVQVDASGRPQAIEPSSHTTKPLKPINAQWLTPDEKDPARWRILFQTEKAAK